MSKKQISKKQNLGQFFTTNVDFILKGFEKLVKGKSVLDPFAGGGDLLNWAERNGAKSVKGHDIDRTCLIDGKITHNDSLDFIPESEFNLTNPPYLAKNKMSPDLKVKYLFGEEVDDFYLLAMKGILQSGTKEGIIIVPVNFFSAENSSDIRKAFLSKYNIGRINYFKEQVFDDTTYNVVAFHYFEDASNNNKRVLNFHSFPDSKQYSITVEGKYYYSIAGKEVDEILSAGKILKTKRLTIDMIDQNPGRYLVDGYFNDYDSTKTFLVNKKTKEMIDDNIIIFNCIDGKSEDNKICAKDIRFFRKDCLVGKNSSRNIAYVILEGVPVKTQAKLIEMFNQKLNDLRVRYNSLFLTNFRDNDRKRISFDFCYQLLNYCYIEMHA